ncbi:MAG: ABC transporter permease [Myxococcales bacterium]
MTPSATSRFYRVYVFAVLAFAALVGAVLVVQMGFGLQKFGGQEYILRVVALSCVRSVGPGVAGSALLLSFVVAAHPWPAAQLQAQLVGFVKRGALLTLPGFALAVATALGVALVLCHALFAVPWAAGPAALGSVERNDWLAGTVSALADAALIAFLAWRYLPRLQAGRSSLPMKLVIAWTFGTGLRMTVGLLVSMLLPG